MRTLPIVLLSAIALLGGCKPLEFSLRLGPTSGEVVETSVGGDPGASAKVALIEVRGLIADGSEPTLFGAGGNPLDRLYADLARAERDTGVKAVILRVSSPGGTVAASDTMYREIRAFRERSGKPVVAHFGEVAASGGYYIALACDTIISEPASITGSVGVMMPSMNVSAGLESIGIESRTVRSGDNKDLANPLEPMRESHFQILQGIVDTFYADFRALVVEHRPGIDASDLDRATDGRVFTGRQAERIGLVDATGGLWDAFDLAKELAGVSRARLVKYYVGSSPPRSAYALESGVPAPLLGSSGMDRLLKTVDPTARTGSGVYYLWVPPTP